ncbi:hypothetical protein [Streptacidiphilus sp. ASG 303]|uniref:hypothetical protein n=1 Tax=Streptomycetaceae TaxID=2062 RepID=UPI001E52F161|nr:hypothetical protein [Streptacidiphilus sp. ASG 303]MCD0480898.1 hypothetical protein [Streptacidiphilus sp. ASG 303]
MGGGLTAWLGAGAIGSVVVTRLLFRASQLVREGARRWREPEDAARARAEARRRQRARAARFEDVLRTPPRELAAQPSVAAAERLVAERAEVLLPLYTG